MRACWHYQDALTGRYAQGRSHLHSHHYGSKALPTPAPKTLPLRIQVASVSALERLTLVQGALDTLSRRLDGTSAGQFLAFLQGSATGCVVVVVVVLGGEWQGGLCCCLPDQMS